MTNRIFKNAEHGMRRFSTVLRASALVVALGSDAVQAQTKPAARSITIKLQKVFTTGGSDDSAFSPSQLYRSDFGFGESGRLFALDRDQNQVVELDKEGRIVKQIGRKGSGPGELASPMAIWIGGKSDVFVADGGKGALVRLNVDGAPPTEMRTTGIGNVAQVLFVSADKAVLSGDRRDSAIVLDLKNPGRPVATMAKSSTKHIPAYEVCGVRMSLPPLLSPKLVAGADRSILAFNADGMLSVTWVDKGGVRRRLDGPDDRTTMTARKVREYLGDSLSVSFGKRTCWVRTENVAKDAGFSIQGPGYSAIVIDEMSQIWALRTKPIQGPQLVDLYTVKGGYIGTAALGGANPVAIRNGRIASLEKDEDGAPHIVVYSFPTVRY